jgi:hypothetical protein
MVRDLMRLMPDIGPILEKHITLARAHPDPAFSIVARRRLIADAVTTAISYRVGYDEVAKAAALLALGFGVTEGRRMVKRTIPRAERVAASAAVARRADTRAWAARTAARVGRRAADAAVRDVIGGTNTARRATRAMIVSRTLLLARNSTADAARDGLFLAYGEIPWMWRTEFGACQICRGMDGTRYTGREKFRPAHLNCRCRPEPQRA